MKVLLRSRIYQQKTILPGRSRNLLFSLFYLSLLVIAPLLYLIGSLHAVSYVEIKEVLLSKRVLDAFYVSFSCSILAAIIDLILGVIIAWVLVKYDFFGRKFMDSIVDLPFAMPTAVSGITLAIIYSDEGWIGKYLATFGVQISYTRIGIIIALVFVGLPFVVRAVQPAIENLDTEMEEAAACLGAKRMDIFKSIIFPDLLPSMITGFTMSLARGLGEYGSVIFIAGNIPYLTEILPLLIVMELEQFDYKAATILAVAMLGASFAVLVLLGFLGNKIKKYYG